MTQDDIRTRLRTLQTKRAQVEAELDAHSSQLQSMGIGTDAPLVDAEGFPRADVDVTAARTARNRVAVLRNDYKALTDEMAKLLQTLHAQERPTSSSTSVRVSSGMREPAVPSGLSLAAPVAVPAHDPAPRSSHVTTAFAVAEDVAEGSPAAAAGVRKGDRLMALAHVTAEGGLAALSSAMPSLENRSIEMLVERAGERVGLKVTPQQWAGRGLLGVYWLPVGGV